MPRTFKTVDYEATLNLTVSIRECLPPEHFARFVVEIVAQLDLSNIYGSYSLQGGKALAPDILLSLLFYGYATGVFSSRAIERATHESIPFRFLAGNLHPDHDTIAHFRQRFLPQIKELFVQVLLIATQRGVLTLTNVSVDGTKIHADASKSKAVSHKRLLEREIELAAEVEALLQLAQQADGTSFGNDLNIEVEIERRQQQLKNLAEAKSVLGVRAEERYDQQKAEYDRKIAISKQREQQTGRKPRGRVPQPPF
jgi:transposase